MTAYLVCVRHGNRWDTTRRVVQVWPEPCTTPGTLRFAGQAVALTCERRREPTIRRCPGCRVRIRHLIHLDTVDEQVRPA